jgi:membrane protease YdiL (CAAX protease family)
MGSLGNNRFRRGYLPGYFLAQSLVAIAFAVFYVLDNAKTLDPQKFLTSLTTNGLLLSLATIVSALVGVTLIIVFTKLRKGYSISEYLGLTRFNNKTLFVLILVSVVLIAISSVIDRFLPSPQSTNFTIDAYKTSVSPALFAVAVVIFAPLFEEGFFRGFVFVGLKDSALGPAGTIALTSAVWAAMHLQYDWIGMSSILVLGFVLGFVRLKTNSLWCAMIIHALWNLTAFVGTALYVNGIG